MRLKLSIAAILVAVLAVGSAALASTSGSSSAARANAVLKLFSTTVQFADLDLGEPGPSLGDQIVFADDLSQQKGSPTIGETGVACTIVRIDGHTGIPTAQCIATARLHEGQITVQGLITFDAAPGTGRFVLAITGGTGAYRNARGQLIVQEVSETEANLTFELSGV